MGLKTHLSASLALYIATVAYLKKDDTRDTQRILFATASALAYLIWSIRNHGSFEAFPRILPLAIISLLGVSSYALTRKYWNTYDRIAGNVGPLYVMIITLYAIIPRYESFARHLDIILLVAFGLPLIYAAPYILGSKSSIISPSLYDEAYEASILAYRRKEPPTGVEYEYVQNTSTGTRCLIMSSPNKISVSFSGTDSKFDWFRTNFKGVPDPETGIHSGFLDAWESIRDKVLVILGDMLIRSGGGKKTTAVISGHSLGGALAVVSANDIREVLDSVPLTIVTFGAPPVATRQFFDTFAFSGDMYRVVTVHDPIPKLLVGGLEHPPNAHEVDVATPNTVASHELASYKRRGPLGQSRVLVLQSFVLAAVVAFFSIR